MTRNAEQYFTEVPAADVPRSMFDLSFNHKLSGDFGNLIPFYVQEVYPADTFNVTTSIVCRLQTLLTPVADDAMLDTYYFFVPNRILWSHWKNFMGEATESAWLDQTTYAPPLLSYPQNGFNVGTIADYMGIPVGVNSGDDRDKPIVFPFRAYAMIANEFFRDQSLTDPLNIPLGDANQTGTNGSSYINDVANGGQPFKVAKLHDYFTSCLPQNQKGDPVNLPLAKEGYFPVVSIDPANMPVGMATQTYPVEWTKTNASSADNARLSYSGNTVSSSGTNPILYPDGNNVGLAPINLWAAAGSVVATTVSDLRMAFQLQRFLEKQAYGGSRYREILQNFFGVTSQDSRMMIPEYLGGHRIPITIHQIANQSESTNSYLGDLGAMSNTSDVHEDFTKSFVEHGWIIGVMCARTNKTYGQGLERFWSRRTREEWYWPQFAHLSNMAVKKREIYMSSNGDNNDAAFGFQEAWSDLRFRPSRCSAEMRPGVTNSLAHWHFGDYYTSMPSLSDTWIREDKTNVDRCLAVTSSVSNQFFCDIYVKNIATRPLPLYSVPGLIDHF